MGLGVAKHLLREIRLLAADRPAELPEMDADLICPTGEGANLQKGSTVIITLHDFKFRHGR